MNKILKASLLLVVLTMITGCGGEVRNGVIEAFGTMTHIFIYGLIGIVVISTLLTIAKLNKKIIFSKRLLQKIKVGFNFSIFIVFAVVIGGFIGGIDLNNLTIIELLMTMFISGIFYATGVIALVAILFFSGSYILENTSINRK
ncbi:MAG: hypothetical protein COB67_02385 [SAR324 cluster bacterium]|uniref:Uncharacterized protein n=1 Tax=SAR324 cluster bacterium TaxID=2024889 RepID=A0A2A4T9D9_9DELT|nr:MAG: hypothetical protein COB67_02385 [SAR324 cluster bacterium]